MDNIQEHNNFIVTELLPSNNKGIHLKTERQTILLLVHVFIAKGTCLPRSCLAIKEGVQFTKALPSNDRKDTYTDTQTDGRTDFYVCL
jgi:hypothetical protein